MAWPVPSQAGRTKEEPFGRNKIKEGSFFPLEIPVLNGCITRISYTIHIYL